MNTDLKASLMGRFGGAFLLFLLSIMAFAAEKVVVINSSPGNARVEYGIDRVKMALEKQGYLVDVSAKAKASKKDWKISVAIDTTQTIAKEGYSVKTAGKSIATQRERCHRCIIRMY